MDEDVLKEVKKPSKSLGHFNPENDKWYTWEPGVREEAMKAANESLHALMQLTFRDSNDKRQAISVFTELGLFRTFMQLRDVEHAKQKRAQGNRGRVDPMKVYRNVIEQFMTGKWGDVDRTILKETARGFHADRAEDLLKYLRKREGARSYSLTEIVEWVAEHLLDPLDSLEGDGIPNGEALSMLVWAKQHQSDFRSMYDNKRMPNKAQLERGVGMEDSGRTAEALIVELLAVREGIARKKPEVRPDNGVMEQDDG
jgi:hypothetical protein